MAGEDEERFVGFVEDADADPNIALAGRFWGRDSGRGRRGGGSFFPPGVVKRSFVEGAGAPGGLLVAPQAVADGPKRHAQKAHFACLLG